MDGADEIILMLFRKENSVHSILNCIQGTAGAVCDDRTTARLRFNRDYSEILACGENQASCRAE